MTEAQKFFEIFKTPEDYRNWDKLIQHCDVIEGITEYDRERIKRAFQFLKKELGEDFLEKVTVENHPIVSYLVNFAPWTRFWFAYLADYLRQVKSFQGYQNLLNKLRGALTFNEAFSVLETAYKFSKAGFAVSFDPSVQIRGKPKTPDLLLTEVETNENLFVEVTMISESKKSQEAWISLRSVTSTMFRNIPFVYYCGRLQKSLSKPHLAEVVNKVEAAATAARTEGTFQELLIEGVLELGMAPESDKQLLDQWASQRGFRVGSFMGPSGDVDEISRTRSRIVKEQKQLPIDRPSIEVIQSNGFFMRTRDFRHAISELEEGVYELPNLLAVIIAGGHMGARNEETTLMKEQHMFQRKMRGDLFVDEYVIILNRYCKLMVSPSAISRVYSAFRDY